MIPPSHDGHARILVVDDEALPRMLLSTSLRESGYEVLEAEGGAAALERLRAEAVDVILLDLVMPDVDGFHVLKQMKAEERLAGIPVVVVSASDDMDSVVRSIEMGAIDHLSKPFDPVLLHARVRSALAIRHVERERTSAAAAKRRLFLPDEESGEPTAAAGAGAILVLKRLFHWCGPYRRQLAFFAGLIMVALGIEAALPLGFKYITDSALLGHDLRLLILVPSVLVCALVVAAFAQVLADRFYVRLATKILNDLRFNMYRHLQNLSMGYFARTPAGALTARFTIATA